MNVSRLFVSILLFLPFACIDRIIFEIDLPPSFPISVSGRITNQPGPYKVYLTSSFDIESDVNLKTPVSAKHVNLLDELGNNEELVEVEAGVYQTNSTLGRIGGVYQIRIEFSDGRIYESIPDTLLAPGEIDRLYYTFNSKTDYSGSQSYGFDIFVSGQGNARNDIRYMWNMTGTFKSITRPENINPRKSGCNPIPEEQGKCNFLPPCTGLRNTAPIGAAPIFERIGPCTCCTCWYQVFNNAPVISDALFNSTGDYRDVSIFRVPLNAWIFMFKIHVEVSQFTLTKNAFDFFKSIQAQKEAVGSLFQPVTGKIANTFIQVSGSPSPINGIFYAAGASTKSEYISGSDVPAPIPVPEVDFSQLGAISCFDLYPHASNVKPDFWED